MNSENSEDKIPETSGEQIIPEASGKKIEDLNSMLENMQITMVGKEQG